MSYIFKSELFQAVIGGVLVYLMGIYFDRLYIAPLKKYNELRTTICYCLTHYANAYSNPYSEGKCTAWHDETSNKLRIAASKIDAFAQKRKFLAIFSMPPKKELKEVADLLRSLSNNMEIQPYEYIGERNRKTANAIRLYLKLNVKSYKGLYNIVESKRCRKRIPKQYRSDKPQINT